jgi:hypothetical protein
MQIPNVLPQAERITDWRATLRKVKSSAAGQL